MNCHEATLKLKDLKLLRGVYYRMLKDPHNSLYGDSDLKRLINMTNEEIRRIIELMYNMELEDSYDQNTGEVNKIYRSRTEEENLLRFCGGPSDVKNRKR